MKQRKWNDCAICCIAMATKKSYAEVDKTVKEYWRFMYGQDQLNGLSDFDEMVVLKKLGTESFYYSRLQWQGLSPQIKNKGPCIFTMRSKNYDNMYHAVYYDGKVLHDPSRKKKYTKKEAFKKAISATYIYS